jgi:hypothetical protein
VNGWGLPLSPDHMATSIHTASDTAELTDGLLVAV